MIVVVVYAEPAHPIAEHGGTDTLNKTVHHSGDVFIAERCILCGDFMPPMEKVTIENVVFIKLTPEFGPDIVSIVEL